MHYNDIYIRREMVCVAFSLSQIVDLWFRKDSDDIHGQSVEKS